ncbi:hypothetical protein Angca_007351, partial [Angiostrongylus cantonensis]
RFEVSSAPVLRRKNYHFLDRNVTRDEKWILCGNRRCPARWSDGDQGPQHFPKARLHKKKIMVTVWCSAAGLIHHNFLNPAETTNGSIDVVSSLNDIYRRINRSCTSQFEGALMNEHLPPKKGEVVYKGHKDGLHQILPHPPYSPDLSPADYHFFKHFDKLLCEKSFEKQAEI